MTDIFVFGSNLAGRHGKGAALHAAQYCGAQRGVGFGPTGNAYAIPTKDRNLQTLPLKVIRDYVKRFLKYAEANPQLTFKITAVGTGLAGYSHAQMAPMFKDVTPNCVLPDEWYPALSAHFAKQRKYRLGTGAQAIKFAIEEEDDHWNRLEFLKSWQDGSLADEDSEWPEYQDWLRAQRKRKPRVKAAA